MIEKAAVGRIMMVNMGLLNLALNYLRDANLMYLSF